MSLTGRVRGILHPSRATAATATPATGPFTVRAWLHAHPGAVVQEGSVQVLSTSTDQASSSLAYGIAMTMSTSARNALIRELLAHTTPQNITPPVIAIKEA